MPTSAPAAMIPTSRRLAWRQAFFSSASWAMPSITRRMGAAACGPTAALASGTKMRRAGKPEKPRASEATKAAATSRMRADAEWRARRSAGWCPDVPFPALWGKVGMRGCRRTMVEVIESENAEEIVGVKPQGLVRRHPPSSYA